MEGGGTIKIRHSLSTLFDTAAYVFGLFDTAAYVFGNTSLAIRLWQYVFGNSDVGAEFRLLIQYLAQKDQPELLPRDVGAHRAIGLVTVLPLGAIATNGCQSVRSLGQERECVYI